MRLFLRLKKEVNDLLRDSMHYRGDLSRQIDHALIFVDLEKVPLAGAPSLRSAQALTAIVSAEAGARVRATAQERRCSITALANAAVEHWLSGKAL